MPSRLLDLQIERRSLGPLKPVGGLVEAQSLDRLAADLDDLSPALRPASHAGPPRITPTKRRPSLSILSSTPRPTKLPSIMA